MLSVIFLFIEALLGAGLVLFRHVARDASAGRAWYLSAHLVNTMLLLAAMTAIAWLATTATTQFRLARIPRYPLGRAGYDGRCKYHRGHRCFGRHSVSGRIACRGHAPRFLERFQYVVAAAAGPSRDRDFRRGYLIWAAAAMLRGKPEGDPLRTAGARVIALALLQVALGAANLSLLAPVWMQLIHLLTADIVWISVVILALEAGKTVSRLAVQSLASVSR